MKIMATPKLNMVQVSPTHFLCTTLVGCGLFLLVGEVGLMSAGGTKVPSKSVEYIVVNLALFPLNLEGGRTNKPVEEVCLLLIALADLALSFACFMISSSKLGSGGVSLAFAERDRGLLLDSAMILDYLV